MANTAVPAGLSSRIWNTCTNAQKSSTVCGQIFCGRWLCFFFCVVHSFVRFFIFVNYKYSWIYMILAKMYLYDFSKKSKYVRKKWFKNPVAKLFRLKITLNVQSFEVKRSGILDTHTHSAERAHRDNTASGGVYSGGCGTRAIANVMNIMTTCSTILFSTHAAYLFCRIRGSGNSHGCFDSCNNKKFHQTLNFRITTRISYTLQCLNFLHLAVLFYENLKKNRIDLIILSRKWAIITLIVRWYWQFLPDSIIYCVVW